MENMTGSGSPPSIRGGAREHSPPHEDLVARLDKCVFEGMPSGILSSALGGRLETPTVTTRLSDLSSDNCHIRR